MRLMIKRWLVVIGLIGVCFFGLALVTAQDSATPYRELVPEVINVYPHDAQAFTQGLLWLDGHLYESTGLNGQSSLRQVDLQTGEVMRIVPIDAAYFAEGLALVDDRLIQLTWRAGEAFVYDLATFEQVDTFTYDGEGWGLCYDDRYLFMSDGTPFISVREADTFDLIVKSIVTIGGTPVRTGFLNELECVGDYIYANMWRLDLIFQIDKTTMQVVGLIDAANLLTEEERAELAIDAGRDVLNGIAYNPQTDTFFITGKNWPKMFEVRFVPVNS